MVRFAEAAEATLGRPVDAFVPVMRRHRAWFIAGAAAFVPMASLLVALGVHDFPRWALAGAAGGLASTGLTRQHLLVRADGGLWLLTARPFRGRPDVLVGAVDAAEITTSEGKFNDVLRIGETRYVLPGVFREHAAALISPPTEPRGESGADDGSSAS